MPYVFSCMFATMISIVFCTSSIGLTVQMYEATSNQALNQYLLNPGDSISTLFRLKNETSADVGVKLWQMGLRIEPQPSAIGNLFFTSSASAPSPLFLQAMPPMVSPTTPLPNSMVLVQHAEIPSVARTIPLGNERNIATLAISSDANASGEFRVILDPFNPQNPFAGSSWISSAPVPTMFANLPAPDSQGKIVLGTIRVVPELSTQTMTLVLLLFLCALSAFRQKMHCFAH